MIGDPAFQERMKQYTENEAFKRHMEKTKETLQDKDKVRELEEGMQKRIEEGERELEELRKKADPLELEGGGEAKEATVGGMTDELKVRCMTNGVSYTLPNRAYGSWNFRVICIVRTHALKMTLHDAHGIENHLPWLLFLRLSPSSRSGLVWNGTHAIFHSRCTFAPTYSRCKYPAQPKNKKMKKKTSSKKKKSGKK